MANKKIYALAAVVVMVFVGLFSANSFSATTTSEEMSSDDISAGQGFQGFIKFASVNGESTDVDHKSWSDLFGFEQGQHQPDAGASGMSRRRADVVMDDIVVVKELDKASPKLAEAVCKGTVFPKVEIHIQRTVPDVGSIVFYKYELTNVMIKSYVIWSEEIPTIYPMEEMTLSYEEIKVTYTEYDQDGKAKGNVEYTWKVEEGEP